MKFNLKNMPQLFKNELNELQYDIDKMEKWVEGFEKELNFLFRQTTSVRLRNFIKEILGE